MGPATARMMIDAPREQVFELISDLALRPSFCDHFQSEFHLQRIESRGVGAAARFNAAAPRFPIWMETVITEVDAPMALSERGKGGRQDRIPLGTMWELTDGMDKGTTEISVTFWTEPALTSDSMREKLGARGWYKRQWKRALRRLKDIAESGERPERLQVAGASRI